MKDTFEYQNNLRRDIDYIYESLDQQNWLKDEREKLYIKIGFRVLLSHIITPCTADIVVQELQQKDSSGRVTLLKESEINTLLIERLPDWVKQEYINENDLIYYRTGLLLLREFVGSYTASENSPFSENQLS